MLVPIILKTHNFYPRSPCGERLFNELVLPDGMDISIHALLAESDSTREQFAEWFNISIHALLAESDALAQSVVTFLTGFLSTLSLRRATPAK